MSIQIEFTLRNTIRVECSGEVVEVALQLPPASAASDRGRGPAVGMRPKPGGPWPGRPKQGPGVMAIIANKKIKNDELDWLRFNPRLNLDIIDKMDKGSSHLQNEISGAPQDAQRDSASLAISPPCTY